MMASIVVPRFEAVTSGNSAIAELLSSMPTEMENRELKERVVVLERERDEALRLAVKEQETTDRDGAFRIWEQLHRSTSDDGALDRACRFQVPETLQEALIIAQDLFHDRLVVLPRCTRTAAECAVKPSLKEMASVWKLLVALATNLHDIVFRDESKNVERDFTDLTGFGLALREGAQTNDNGSCVAARLFEYEGVETDFTVHAKWDRGRKRIRAHLHFDHDRHVVVLGHFGDHLETAGTRHQH